MVTSHSRRYRVEYPLAVGSMRKAQLDAMAQEATVPTPPPAGAEWIDVYRHWLG